MPIESKKSIETKLGESVNRSLTVQKKAEEMKEALQQQEAEVPSRPISISPARILPFSQR